MARPVWCSLWPGKATNFRVNSSPFSFMLSSQICCCSSCERHPLTGTIYRQPSISAISRERRVAAVRSNRISGVSSQTGMRRLREASFQPNSRFTSTRLPVCMLSCVKVNGFIVPPVLPYRLINSFQIETCVPQGMTHVPQKVFFKHAPDRSIYEAHVEHTLAEFVCGRYSCCSKIIFKMSAKEYPAAFIIPG